MADAVLLKDCRVWLGPYALHQSLRSINLTNARAELADSVMGDVHEAFAQGLQQPDIKFGGRWGADAAATSLEPDTILYNRIGGSGAVITSQPFTVAPPNAPAATPAAAGNVVYTLVGKTYSYSGIKGAHGELAGYEGSGKGATGGGGLYRGVSLSPATNFTATTNGSAVQAGAVSATQKYVCVLHVTQLAGGTWTVTVESDNASNFPTPTTRATFTGATAITSQVIETNGAVTDDWWRIVVTETVGGTDVTLAAMLHIVPQ